MVDPESLQSDKKDAQGKGQTSSDRSESATETAF